MESMLKKSLAVPIKQLRSCISGQQNDGWPNKGGKKTRGSKGKSATWSRQNALEAHQIRAYQADLEKERKLRQARNAQKNAERAAMREHYRRKYQLSKNVKDIDHLKMVGGKVALPRELAAMARPEAPTKNEGYSLFGAFQGLSLNLGMVSGNTRSQTPTPVPNVDQCKVM